MSDEVKPGVDTEAQRASLRKMLERSDRPTGRHVKKDDQAYLDQELHRMRKIFAELTAVGAGLAKMLDAARRIHCIAAETTDADVKLMDETVGDAIAPLSEKFAICATTISIIYDRMDALQKAGAK